MKKIIRFYSGSNCLSIIETSEEAKKIGDLSDAYQKLFNKIKTEKDINSFLVYLINNGIRFRELNKGGEYTLILN